LPQANQVSAQVDAVLFGQSALSGLGLKLSRSPQVSRAQLTLGDSKVGQIFDNIAMKEGKRESLNPFFANLES
jgi:hypothetical protein